MLLDDPLPVIAAAVRADPGRLAELVAEAGRRITEDDVVLGAVVDRAPDPGCRNPGGALAGVPYLIKDLQADLADLPLRAGSRALRHRMPRGDSTLIGRLRDAGVVILGRTNTPELGLNITTEPQLHGPTRNPWDHTRSAGGSSGGAAAAVAAGLVPAAHATDSGGSTRIPAAWCGVVGFKPSRGTNPAGPHRLDDWMGLSHEHAITRSVADTRELLAVTAGAAPGEWHPPPHPRPATERCVVGVLRAGPGGATVAPVYERALADAVAELASLGHRVVDLEPVAEAAEIGPVFGTIVAAHLARLVRGEPVERPADDLEPAVHELVLRGQRLAAADLVDAVDRLHELGFRIGGRFAGVDVVLSPTTAWPAPALGAVSTASPAADLFAEIFRLSPFAAMFNVTGGPGLSLPWGLDGDGMPIGLHLGAAPGGDGTVLDLAEQLERRRPDLTRLVPPAYRRVERARAGGGTRTRTPEGTGT